jgi:pSer/pThr/pTyr-binding forkhead associated (FHA) protein
MSSDDEEPAGPEGVVPEEDMFDVPEEITDPTIRKEAESAAGIGLSSTTGEETVGKDDTGTKGDETEAQVKQEEDAPDDGKPKKKKKRLGWTRKIETLYFDVMQSSKLVDQLPMGKKEKILIGRLKEAEITLHNPSISRKHAAICVGVAPDSPAMDAGGITLIDLKASNGTYYSTSWPCRPDVRIKLQKGQSAVLKEGYCFRFGESSRSFVVRGLSTASRKNKDKNPNFAKPGGEDINRDKALGKELGIEQVSKKRSYGALIGANPFKEQKEIKNTAFLPSLAQSKSQTDLSEKLLSGGTTFSFHQRKKSEIDSIRFEHEHKMKKRVLEMKKAEADRQTALDMTDN